MGVATVAAPIRFRNKNLISAPVIHGANRLAEWTSPLEGVKNFLKNESECPAINYLHIPVRALFELRRAVDGVKRQLGNVTCPVAVLQGTDDPVVQAKSAELIYAGLASTDKQLHMIPADRHGILREDVGETHDILINFINHLETGHDAALSLPPPVEAHADTVRR